MPILGSAHLIPAPSRACGSTTTSIFISVAARMLGMHPQTLRKYERLGLVQPSRTMGSMRLYSRDELERLKAIKRLVEDGGINLAGVQRLLSVAEVVQRIRPLMRDEPLSARDARRLGAGARRAHTHAGIRLTWTSRTTTPRSACPRPPPRRKSSRRSGSSRASIIPTSTRATRPPRRSSRRSTRPTRCSAIRRSARSTTSSGRTGGCTSRRAPAEPGAQVGRPFRGAGRAAGSAR